MVCHISIRGVQRQSFEDHVVIVARSDVPSILTMRLSPVEPQTHNTTSFRRGLPWYEDLRFCFVAFSDIAQDEALPSLVHTFTIPGWLPCETKWFYFFGSIGGQTCVSTSPVFSYHNAWVAPPPPAHPSYLPLAGGPYLVTEGTGDRWLTYDLSERVPAEATGVLLFVRWTVTTNYIRWCVRPTGSTFNDWSGTASKAIWCCYLPLNEARQIDIYTQLWGGFEFWLMGTFGTQVGWTGYHQLHFLQMAGWQTFDISHLLPSPDTPAAILYCMNTSGGQHFGVRPMGGTPEEIKAAIGQFVVVKLTNGQFQYGIGNPAAWPNLRLYLMGYVKKDYYGYTASPGISPPGTYSWQEVNVSGAHPSPRLLFLYMRNTVGAGAQWGYRSPSQPVYTPGLDRTVNWGAVAPEEDIVLFYRQYSVQWFYKNGVLY